MVSETSVLSITRLKFSAPQPYANIGTRVPVWLVEPKR